MCATGLVEIVNITSTAAAQLQDACCTNNISSEKMASMNAWPSASAVSQSKELKVPLFIERLSKINVNGSTLKERL